MGQVKKGGIQGRFSARGKGLHQNQTSKERREIMQRACHDFRHPLAIIHAYEDLLEDQMPGPLNSEVSSSMVRIRIGGIVSGMGTT